MKVFRYLKARLCEKSTWAAIGAGALGAAAVSPPWSYIFVATAVIAALIPSTPDKEPAA